MDRGDYTLNRKIFKDLCKRFAQFHFTPQVDMFASPGNRKYKNFVARWPHHQAFAHNALETPMEKAEFQEVYANPPGK